MAVDFRFNGQQSYSPLLTALAEAPMNKAKLAIAQQQNQRQRLTDLLSQMSSAATLGRTIQTQLAIKRQSDLAGGPNSVGGNAALIAPEGFAGIAGQLPATMQSINAAFPSMQPQQTSQPNDSGMTQTATPGSIPISNEEGVLGNVRNRLVNRALFGEPKQGTDANTNLTMETYPGSGMAPKIINPPKEGELDPMSREYLIKRNDAFASDIKPMVDQIRAAKQLSAITSAKIPAAGIPTIVEALKAGGLSRITQYETTAAGKDKSLVENAKQTATGLIDGTLTNVNQEQLQALSTVLEKSAQFNIDEIKNSYIDQSMEEHGSLGRDKYDKTYSAVARRQTQGSYDPGVYKKGKGLVKGPQSVDDVKVGQVYNGHRYKGGDKTDKNSWVKVK